MADASIGEIEIVLDGKPITLRSTLAVAKRVNAFAGGSGYFGVLGKLGTLDLDTYVAVIAAALDKKSIDIEDKVYRAGMTNLMGDLSLFVTYLSNGGKPLEAAKDGAETGEA